MFSSLTGKTSLPFPKCELNSRTRCCASPSWSHSTEAMKQHQYELVQNIWKTLRHSSIPYSFSLKALPHTPVSVYQAFLSLAAAQTLKTSALIYLYLELVIPVLALLFPLCPYFVQFKMKRRNQVELCLVCVPCSVARTAFFSFLVQCSSASEI